MAISVWAALMVWEYLARTVFAPVVIPHELRPRPRQLDVDTLQAARDGQPDVQSIAVAHYHGSQSWFQADPGNTCTTSGCHSPLPHERKKETRAFANFHANFLSCELCHEPTPPSGRFVWVSTATRAPVEPPAVLRLMKWLEPTGDPPVAGQHESGMQPVRMLQEIVTLTGGDAVLRYLASQLETSEPGSPQWRHSISRLRQELPRYVRGDYGAKIALLDPERQNTLRELANRYSATDRDDRLRDELRNRIHERLNTRPVACQDCHRGPPSGLDFVALGYSVLHSQHLQHTPLTAMIQHIGEGRRFHLPSLGGEQP
jgi:hypothetical protein